MSQKLLAPSLLSADFARLDRELAAVEAENVSWIHLDVMDGLFVPSISFGIPVIKSLRPVSKLFFDVHLMIVDPDRYLEAFRDAGADLLTVHAEACKDCAATIEKIHALGLKAGISVNPETDLEAIKDVAGLADMILIMSVHPGFGGQKYIEGSTEKIRRLREFLDEKGLSPLIEVDGGIYPANCREVLEAGADVLVSGSGVFKGDIAANIAAFNEILQTA